MAPCRYRSLRTSSNLLVVNLAMGDLLMCAVDFPLFVTASFMHSWPFGKIVCQTYGVLTGTAGLVTINTLAVISLDRYHAVSNHLHPAQPRPTRTTVAAAVGVWVYSLPWAMAPTFGWGDYVLDGIGTTCTFDFLTKSFNNLSFVVAITASNFFIPLCVIVFSYTGIWLVVRATHVSLRRQREITVSIGTQRHRLGMQSDLKTASIILVIVTTFLLSWTPYLVICCLGLFGDGSQVTIYSSLLPSIVAKTSTALNPVLYSISHPKVRRKLRCILRHTMPRLIRRLTRSHASSISNTTGNGSRHA
ncbi:hypothetical protein ACOMHN_026791 [Nucella lapillus]